MIQTQLVGVLFTLILSIGSTRSPADVAENVLMFPIGQEFGKPNPNAPPELSRFGFLIGKWLCEARVRSANGEPQIFQATWVGRYVLDGYAIADEYWMSDPSGKLVVLGMNFRTYNAAEQTWNIKWLNALTGIWTDLAPSELGGAHFDGQSITYAFREPTADHRYTRATYTSVSKSRFTWRGEKSDDAKSWSEFMVCDCVRAE